MSLSYDLQGDTLYAFDNAGNQQGQTYDVGADRLVFTFHLNPATGQFEFKLFDQVDHDEPNSGADQNYDLQNDPPGDVEWIDFGHILKATDFDGDSVVLEDMLKIRIRDDIPELVHNAKVYGIVEEEQLAQGNEDTTSGPPDLDSDTNGDLNKTTTIVSGTGANSLASLVDVGADENGTFAFKSSGIIGGTIKTTDGDTVTSDGADREGGFHHRRQRCRWPVSAPDGQGRLGTRSSRSRSMPPTATGSSRCSISSTTTGDNQRRLSLAQSVEAPEVHRL